MKLTWDVDRDTIVQATVGGFKKKILTVNGDHRTLTLSLRKKSEFPFDLPDGRRATIKTTPHYAAGTDIELRVDGQLMVPTEKTAPKCAACGTETKPNDRFCDACGKPMAPAENYLHEKRIKEAAGAIWVLAALFSLSGIVTFFLTRSNDAAALAKLAALDPSAQFPKTIDGVNYTVGALRNKILWESWSVLIVNGILASVMVALAYWGRRAASVRPDRHRILRCGHRRRRDHQSRLHRSRHHHEDHYHPDPLQGHQGSIGPALRQCMTEGRYTPPASVRSAGKA
jgi:hypothetical protein